MSLTVPVTPARRAILVAGVPAVLVLIAFLVFQWGRAAVNVLANGDQVGYSVGFSAQVLGSQSRLTVNNANITVQPGSSSRIHVHGSLFGTISRPSFHYQNTSRGLLIDPSCAVPVGNCSLSLRARLPARLPVTVNDNFGNLTAAGLKGRITLSNNSGNLTATGLSGTIRLTSQFSEVNATDLSGGIQITSNNGDITASRLTGDTRLQNSFGTITVTGLAAASVQARSNSGNITLVFSTVPRSVYVSDSFGSVTLKLPPGPATYRVDAPTPQFGSRTVTVPQSPASAHVITVRGSNDDVTITNK